MTDDERIREAVRKMLRDNDLPGSTDDTIVDPIVDLIRRVRAGAAAETWGEAMADLDHIRRCIIDFGDAERFIFELLARWQKAFAAASSTEGT